METKSGSAMNRIYIETDSPKNGKRTNEYRFFEHLLEILKVEETDIFGIGGKDKLSQVENQFKDITKRGGKNLVIIDADGKWNVEDWDFESQSKEYNDLRQKLGVEFELFLLPDNQSQGDFETLLERIVPEKHRRIIDCLIKSEDCIRGYGEYVTPNQKARMYGYITSFERTLKEEEDLKKGDWFFNDGKFWDFSVDTITPLKTFILSHFS